ncbi:MAG: PTS transporter subunit IIC [Candidatus Humimicrobiaceae bacterium]
MEVLYKIMKVLVNIGPVGLIPIVLLLMGLIASRNKLILLRNSVYVFLGLLSFSLLLSFYINFFNPVIETILSITNKKFQVIDVGWMMSQKINLYNPMVVQLAVILIGLNILMIFLRLTRTINIDLWNLWIFLFSGIFVYEVTGIMWMGILFSCVIATITFVMADIYAPYIESYYGLKGVSNPQAQTVVWAPISELVNFTLNRIPFIKRLHVFYEEIQYKLGVAGEPLIIGFILGFVIGAIARYRNFAFNFWPSLGFAAFSGMNLSIITILMPRSVTLLYKGLIPIINDIRTFINSKITKREIYIGLNSLFVAGNASVIGLSTIMIPLTVYIATILPGNKVLPGADLVIIPLILVWAVGPSKGDIFRSFISALIIIPLVLLITTDMTGLITDFLTKKETVQIVEGYSKASSLGMGSNLIYWILTQIIKPMLKLFS